MPVLRCHHLGRALSLLLVSMGAAAFVWEMIELVSFGRGGAGSASYLLCTCSSAATLWRSCCNSCTAP